MARKANTAGHQGARHWLEVANSQKFFWFFLFTKRTTLPIRMPHPADDGFAFSALQIHPHRFARVTIWVGFTNRNASSSHASVVIM